MDKQPSDKQDPRRWCQAARRNGAACHAAPLFGSPYCFVHDPGRASDRARARRLGGFRRTRPLAEPVPMVPLRNADAIRLILEETCGEVRRLEPGVAKARTIAYIAGVALRVLEVGELEARVAALEQVTRRKE